MSPTQRLSALTLLLLSLLAGLAAASEKVYIDYDHEVDFSKFETFAYAPAKSGMRSQDELIDKWVVEGIVERLEKGRLRQVDTDADIIVTYQVIGQSAARTDILDLGPTWGGGWGYGPNFNAGWAWGGAGWWSSTAMVTDYKVGTFVVEAFDTSTKLAIWRGASEYMFFDDYDKASKAIHKSLSKMSKKWRQLHKGK